jgi:hypothetical protein
MVFYVKRVIGSFDEKCGENDHDFFKVLSTVFKDWQKSEHFYRIHGI